MFPAGFGLEHLYSHVSKLKLNQQDFFAVRLSALNDERDFPPTDTGDHWSILADNMSKVFSMRPGRRIARELQTELSCFLGLPRSVGHEEQPLPLDSSLCLKWLKQLVSNSSSHVTSHSRYGNLFETVLDHTLHPKVSLYVDPDEPITRMHERCEDEEAYDKYARCLYAAQENADQLATQPQHRVDYWFGTKQFILGPSGVTDFLTSTGSILAHPTVHEFVETYIEENPEHLKKARDLKRSVEDLSLAPLCPRNKGPAAKCRFWDSMLNNHNKFVESVAIAATTMLMSGFEGERDLRKPILLYEPGASNIPLVNQENGYYGEAHMTSIYGFQQTHTQSDYFFISSPKIVFNECPLLSVTPDAIVLDATDTTTCETVYNKRFVKIMLSKEDAAKRMLKSSKLKIVGSMECKTSKRAKPEIPSFKKAYDLDGSDEDMMRRADHVAVVLKAHHNQSLLKPRFIARSAYGGAMSKVTKGCTLDIKSYYYTKRGDCVYKHFRNVDKITSNMWLDFNRPAETTVGGQGLSGLLGVMSALKTLRGKEKMKDLPETMHFIWNCVVTDVKPSDRINMRTGPERILCVIESDYIFKTSRLLNVLALMEAKSVVQVQLLVRWMGMTEQVKEEVERHEKNADLYSAVQQMDII